MMRTRPSQRRWDPRAALGSIFIAAVLTMAGCRFVEDEPTTASATRLAARSVESSVAKRGDSAFLTFQAVDESGAPVDGADVFVALPGDSPLRLKNPEAAPGTTFARAKTSKQTVDHLTISGAFVVEVEVGLSAAEGRYPVFAGLGSVSFDTTPGAPIVEIDVLVPAVPDAGTDAPADVADGEVTP